MSTATEQRPPQATIAAWMVIIGSVVVVFTVWEQIGTLRSIDSRAAIESFLADPPGSTLGLDVESVISLLRVASMVAAGCAVATGILGWHVLQRNRQARIALTVFAVPLFVSGLFVGGFVSSVVAASAALLWMPPSREWFKYGRWTPPSPASRESKPESASQSEPGSESAQPDSDPWTAPPTQQTGTTPGGIEPTQPPPAASPYASTPTQTGATQTKTQTAPFGAPAHPYAAPEQQHAPYAMPDGPVTTPPAPRGVITAFVLTALFSALAILMSAIGVVAMLVSPDLIMDELVRQQPELADQGVTTAMLTAVTVVMGLVCIVWSLAALVMGVFVLRRREWARRGLMLCAGAAAGACLVSALGSPVVLVPAVAAIISVVLLRRPDVRAWFALP